MEGHIYFGNLYRDTVTGFIGEATGKSRYSTGPDRVLLEARDANGAPVAIWLDVDRVEPES